ncbi:beta-propeller domain-containing protein [Streptosporangium sp. NPDC051023]|uniref:beta-propeller domain-containing protein n=1 Tax=Streptosporangium sp. NPDC051023 TaxID=3155410 RepID=UPI00344CB7CF
MRTSIRTAGAVTLAAALLATGCSSTETVGGASRTTPVVDLGKVKLVSYSGCDDMLTGLRAAAVKNVGPWGLGASPIMYAEARSDVVSPQAKSSVGSGQSQEHSTTNTHEAGVDEPDLVKTDGNRVITVSRGVLRVIDAATRKVTGSLRLVDSEQWWAPADLLLSGDRALVLFSGGGIVPYGAMVKRAASPGPRYVLVDLSGAPKVIGSLTPNGSHVDARMVGSTVRIVVRSQPEIPFPDLGPGDFSDKERTARNAEIVKKAPLKAWLPTFETTDAKGVTSTGSVKCEQVSHPDDYTGTSMLTVHTLDLSQGITDSAPISIAADGDTVYGTGSSLYVASNPRWWWWPRPIDDTVSNTVTETATPASTEQTPQETPKPSGTGQAPQVEPTPTEPPAVVPSSDSSTSPSSPDPATTSPAPTTTSATLEPPSAPPQPPEETEVHRFDISAPGTPRYVASGKVSGRLLNQYSLSEYEGNLRIATTSTSPDGRNSSSAVYVLKGDTMAKVGEIGGLGNGERIYSVRFIGPAGYVVTFKQVDPLYTLDLSDPAAPKKSGELKITGYSAYLHPAGDGRLIGIGQEASEKGRTLGTQVSLFDVSDPANPRRLSQMFQKNSGSEAEWDPHAFLYWAKTGMAVLPLNTWDGTAGTEGSALVLKIDDSSVTKTGTVVHPAPKPVKDTRMAMSDPSIRRSLVIGDSLWTVSEQGLKVSDMNGLADQAWIPFD